MVVMILETVPTSLRGELTRWLVEPHPGVFVGHVSGMVRDKLWEKCCKSVKKGALIQIWATNNEQRFQISDLWGHKTRDCRPRRPAACAIAPFVNIISKGFPHTRGGEPAVTR